MIDTRSPSSARRVADEAELERARLAVDLIHARGFARGRDLGLALAEAMRDLGEP